MLTKEKLPATGFLRLPEVLKLFPVGRSTWWAGIASGRFPKPHRIAARVTAWRVEDIVELLENPDREKFYAQESKAIQ